MFPTLSMRRALPITLVASLLMPAVAAAIALPLSVTIDGQAVVFQDVPSDAWYAEFVEVAAIAGVVSGYKNPQGELTGFFGPGDNVTYAQTMKMAIEAAGYPVEEYPKSEMYGDHWASTYMEIGAQQGFVSAEGDVQDIDRPATRAEAALIMADAFKVERGSMEDENYSDVDDDTAHAWAIAALTRDDVVNGNTNAQGDLTFTFSPGSPVVRGAAVKMAMAAWAEYGDRGEESHPGMVSSDPPFVPETPPPPPASTPPQAEAHVIAYTDAGFSPSDITVKAGESVTFRNNSNSVMWVASDPHPAHNAYAGFDSGVSVAANGVFTFKFTKTGEWSFHNHVSPNNHGKVTVEE